MKFQSPLAIDIPAGPPSSPDGRRQQQPATLRVGSNECANAAGVSEAYMNNFSFPLFFLFCSYQLKEARDEAGDDLPHVLERLRLRPIDLGLARERL